MRTDSLDVSSLVSYINDIKPFHSKLTTVVVEYQANDNVFAAITDKSSMEMQFSSAWELQLVSDGTRTQYRIPAAVFPRYSDDFHQCKRVGVTDEVPGTPGAYFVPYNNGVEVYVNGVKRSPTFDYRLDDQRTIVQFVQNPPKLGDEVCLNWAVIDRIFIRIGDDEWSHFELEFNSVIDGMEMFPYDAGKFDSNAANPVLDGIQTTVGVESLGHVKVLNDATGKPYYVFEFNEALPLDTKIWIRVEQREGYNGWTQTKFTEKVEVKDLVRYKDTVNAKIVDPGTWNVNQELFGIDIAPSRQGNFDVEAFDVMGFDSIQNPIQLGYYTLFNISESLKDSIRAAMVDKYKDQLGLLPKETVAAHVVEARDTAFKLLPKDTVATRVNDLDPGAFDESAFDTVVFDANNPLYMQVKKSGPIEASATAITERLSIQVIHTDGSGSTINAVYAPDANGIVVVDPAADSVEIIHNFGYLPFVSIYLNGELMYPKSLTYPSNNSIIVTFSQPRSVVIRLT